MSGMRVKRGFNGRGGQYSLKVTEAEEQHGMKIR